MSEIKPIIERERFFGGEQKIYKFPNNYGASVVNGFGTYTEEGEWELAVIKFEPNSDEFNLTYDTPITDDVIPNLSTEEVQEILIKIKDLE